MPDPATVLERFMPLLLRLDGLLQRLVPPRTGQVAWASEPDYVGNAFHLYRHTVTTRANLEHVWLVTDPVAGARIDADAARFAGSMPAGTSVRVLRRHSLRGYWARLRSRHIFHTHGIYPMDTAYRREVVSLWHGMPIKCIGALNTVSPDPHPTFGTRHLATSAFFRYVIAAAFSVPVDRVLHAGLPRCDVLACPHPLGTSPEAARAAVGVPAGHRIVVWLPTYRTPGNRSTVNPGAVGFHTFLDDLPPGAFGWIDEHARANDCTVVVKLHPHDPLNEVDHGLGTDHVRFVRAEEWNATGVELYDLLAASDALVSDISSVLIDYLVTARPVGMIGFDADAYERDVVFPVRAVRDSLRVDDLDDEAAVGAFFARVRRGDTVPPEDDDLSVWLYDVSPGEGCETVLAAVGL